MKNQYLWIIFTIFFMILSGYHYFLSKKSIKKPKNYAGVKKISGVNIGIDEFITDFQEYIDDLNDKNKEINLVQSLGYFLAGLTSFYSFWLSLGY